jgi:hypothetical protein
MHSALNWSKKLAFSDAISTFQTMCHNIRTIPSRIKIGSVLFFGPRKCYYLNREDRTKLLKISNQFPANYCYSYEKCLVNGTIYSTVNERSGKKCNYVTDINGSTYIIEKILAISPDPVCVVRKFSLRQSKENNFCYQIISRAERTTIKYLNNCESKFLCSRKGKSIMHLVRLPNSIENE